MRAETKQTTIRVVGAILALIACILITGVFAVAVAAVVWVLGLDGAEIRP